jgi:hypothetical protein
VDRTVVESAEGAGLRAVDLLPCFEPYHYREVRVDVVHPGPLGHRIAAHGVFDALAREGLLGTAQPDGAGRACTDYRPVDFPRMRGY